MKPIILCDIDGVIVDFAESYLRLLADMFGVHKTEADMTSWHYETCVSTPEQNTAIWRDIERNPGFVYNLPAYDGAHDFLRELRELGRVVACTSPANPLWTAERSQALMDKFGFAKKDIVVASDKSLVMGDFLIDDAVHNLEAWYPEAGIWTCPVLFDRPWNRGDSTFLRTSDYAAVLDVVKNNC